MPENQRNDGNPSGTGGSTLEEIGRRFGFLNAFGLALNANDPRVKWRAVRESVLSNVTDLYHYTSLDGLRGIIEENGFWLSDNRFMNDAEEITHGVQLASVVLSHMAKRSHSDAFADVLRNVARRLSEPRKQGNLVACFSQAGDDLGQWRGYAMGGVCLRLGEPMSGEHSLFFGPGHVQYRAVYDEWPKCRNLISVIDAYEREYVLDRLAMAGKWPDHHDEEFVGSLYSRIISAVLGFKDKAFRSEAEVRIVVPYEMAKKYEGGLRFRVSRIGIVPYLRTGDHLAIRKMAGRLPLREVIVGPSSNQTLIAESIETFLLSNGYVNTVISFSKVPFRAI